MDGNFVIAPLERHDRRGFASREQASDGGQRRSRGVQHDVFTLAYLLDAVDSHEQSIDPIRFFFGEFDGRSDENGVTFEYDVDLAKTIGF
jgi:hypothetical protein